VTDVTDVTANKPVLFLIDELEVGGSQQQILLLAKALKKAGHAVTVAYFREGNEALRPTLEQEGIAVKLIAKRGGVDPAFLLRLARFLAEDRSRHVLSFGYTANLWSRVAGAQPISCIRNLGYIPGSRGKIAPVLARVERLLSRRSKWVVANSQVTAESVIARGIIPRERLLVIPNAVEREAHAPREEARARLLAITGESSGSLSIVGTLARLVEPKDLPTLVRAARHVIDKNPDVRFVIGGEGPKRPELEALRRELALEDRFFLPGTLLGRDVVAGLDVAVLSSSSEGMPNFVLEAMAAGIPLVATRAGAAAELLEEGKLGRLVAIGDHRALAEGILDAIATPKESSAMATLAKQKAQGMSPADIAARYIELFESR